MTLLNAFLSIFTAVHIVKCREVASLVHDLITNMPMSSPA